MSNGFLDYLHANIDHLWGYTIAESLTTENHRVGPYDEPTFHRSTKDQIVAAGPDISGDVAYYDATGDFGAAIQQAWDDLATGGYILLPPGSYSGTTTITPTSSGVVLDGLGWHMNSDGSHSDATGTEYLYEGSGNGFDMSSAPSKVQNVVVRGLQVTDNSGTANGSIGFNLDGVDMNNGRFVRCNAFNFDSHGWYLSDIYHYDFEDCWAVSNGGKGFEMDTTSKIDLDMRIHAFYNSNSGAKLAGLHGGQVRGYALLNGGRGFEVGLVRGTEINAVAELNDGSGVHVYGGTGFDLTTYCVNNNQADNSIDYELEVTGNSADGTIGGEVNADTALSNVNAIRINGNNSIYWTDISKSNSGSWVALGGLDHVYPETFPKSVNESLGATTNSNGNIVLSLDSEFSENPTVEVAPTALANVPSGASLAQPTVSFNDTGTNGNVDEVVVSFEWTDGTVPGSGDVTADIKVR